MLNNPFHAQLIKFSLENYGPAKENWMWKYSKHIRKWMDGFEWRWEGNGTDRERTGKKSTNLTGLSSNRQDSWVYVFSYKATAPSTKDQSWGHRLYYLPNVDPFDT